MPRNLAILDGLPKTLSVVYLFSFFYFGFPLRTEIKLLKLVTLSASSAYRKNEFLLNHHVAPCKARL